MLNEFDSAEVESADVRNTEMVKPPGTDRGISKKRKRTPAMTEVISWFAACGRCSIFLAGYKLTCGEEALETAVAERGARWLTFPWQWGLADLVLKTYGSRVDIDCYHYEANCPECRRHFIFQTAEEEAEEANFRIELITR